ncbi:MAG: hypothetical protein EBS60_02440 [Verrucomicrobia bacterium]|nr:hypothetical protein [Verrucomicrobiota bacterium]
MKAFDTNGQGGGHDGGFGGSGVPGGTDFWATNRIGWGDEGYGVAVTGWGADLATARERAYAAVGQIRFSGQHFRRDIGHRALGKVVS